MESLRAFFRAGKCLCPFAARAEHNGLFAVLSDPLLPFETSFDILPTLAAFLATANGSKPTTMLIVAGRDSVYEVAQDWQHRMFCAVMLAIGRHAFPNAAADQLLDCVQFNFALIRDRRASVRPFLVYNDLPIVGIGMGPQYPTEHPRYAPATCLVLNWVHHVESVGETILQRIRRDMIARGGCVYDADEIWLPLAPTWPTKTKAPRRR